MQKSCWYSNAEALADGTIALIGGLVDGGYINRNCPNPKVMQFMVDTCLNSYDYAFVMPSGKMFVTPPDIPGNVIRVYPASGGVAMLPVTLANGYNPILLFCGGSNMPEYDWGNYSWPFVDTWLVSASKDCQRITPEPLDISGPSWEQGDDMSGSRTMVNSSALPTAPFSL